MKTIDVLYLLQLLAYFSAIAWFSWKGGYRRGFADARKPVKKFIGICVAKDILRHWPDITQAWCDFLDEQ